MNKFNCTAFVNGLPVSQIKIKIENKSTKQEPQQALLKTDVICGFPDNVEIWKWWKTQNFQKENGEQEYTMIYEIDLPKILKAFYEYFGNCR